VGDTGGVKNPAPQQLVAYAMENKWSVEQLEYERIFD
jgi:hypothetical protein